MARRPGTVLTERDLGLFGRLAVARFLAAEQVQKLVADQASPQVTYRRLRRLCQPSRHGADAPYLRRPDRMFPELVFVVHAAGRRERVEGAIKKYLGDARPVTPFAVRVVTFEEAPDVLSAVLRGAPMPRSRILAIDEQKALRIQAPSPPPHARGEPPRARASDPPSDALLRHGGLSIRIGDAGRLAPRNAYVTTKSMTGGS